MKDNMMPLNLHEEYLSVLCNTPAETLKDFVEPLLPLFENIEVLQNRTGLIMMPFTESVKKTTFHIGEVLVAEARVKVNGSEGYAACLGRDLEQAVGIAILDAALQGGFHKEDIMQFVQAQAEIQKTEEETLMKQVESTRVEMETF